MLLSVSCEKIRCDRFYLEMTANRVRMKTKSATICMHKTNISLFQITTKTHISKPIERNTNHIGMGDCIRGNHLEKDRNIFNQFFFSSVIDLVISGTAQFLFDWYLCLCSFFKKKFTWLLEHMQRYLKIGECGAIIITCMRLLQFLIAFYLLPSVSYYLNENTLVDMCLLHINIIHPVKGTDNPKVSKGKTGKIYSEIKAN